MRKWTITLALLVAIAGCEGGAADAEAGARSDDAALRDGGVAALDAQLPAVDGSTPSGDAGPTSVGDAGGEMSLDGGAPVVDAGPPSAAEVRRVDFDSGVLPAEETFYLVYLPTGYHSSTRSYPIMLFYVGSGEIGTDRAALERHGPFRTIRDNGGVAPSGFGMDEMIFLVNNQPVRNSNNTHVPLAWEAYQHAVASLRIDTSRAYLAGISMGGNGVHSMAIAHPTAFAAAIPVSAANARVSDADACSVYGGDTALWIFHGENDNPGWGISPANAEDLWRRVQGCPPVHAPRYTLAAGRGHSGQLWNEIFANTGITTWTLVEPGTDALDESPHRSVYDWALAHHR